MSRPKDLLDRIALERVVSEGVVPTGKAVPDASPVEKVPALGVVALPHEKQTTVGAKANPRTGMPDVSVRVSVAPTETIAGRPASPNNTETSPGRTANPKADPPLAGRPATVTQSEVNTGRVADPIVAKPTQGRAVNPKSVDGIAGVPASVKAAQAYVDHALADVASVEKIPGRPATPSKTEVIAGRTVTPKVDQPMRVGEARVFSPETAAGRFATPKILDAIAGVPASMRDRQAFTGQAQVTPKAQVTVTVPPNFPFDPKELFAVVDSLIQLPPRQSTPGAADLSIPIRDSDLESTESFVARSFMANEGDTSDLDRWHL